MAASGAFAWSIPTILSISAAGAQTGAPFMPAFIQVTSSFTGLVAPGSAIPFDTVVAQDGLVLNAPTGSVIANTGGTYLALLSVHLNLPTGGTPAIFVLMQNATVAGAMGLFVENTDTVSVDNLLTLSANDVVTAVSTGQPCVIESVSLVLVQIA